MRKKIILVQEFTRPIFFKQKLLSQSFSEYWLHGNLKKLFWYTYRGSSASRRLTQPVLGPPWVLLYWAHNHSDLKCRLDVVSELGHTQL